MIRPLIPVTAASPRPLTGRTAHGVRRHTIGRTLYRPVLRPGPHRLGAAVTDFDVWRTSLRESMVAVDATPVGDTGRTEYSGWVYTLNLGAVRIADAASSPVRVSRTPRLIAADAADTYQLSIARRPSEAEQAGHRVRLRTGDAVFLDATQPSTVVTDAVFGHQVIVNLPRAELRRSVAVDTGMLGRAIRGDHPGLRVLSALIHRLGHESPRMTPEFMAEMGHTATELVASLLRATAEGRAGLADSHLSRAAQLLRMRDFVERNLADPELSPHTLADAFGVSLRYVETVFHETGDSPARFIRETRLDAARRMLADPRQRHRSIAAVGRSVGLVNASAFSRTFKGRYDISPRGYRNLSTPPTA
ncbi:helix-turn-helix domain-containing protein [Yinghuangia sp. YIM S09857]|uniref:helix-turn-helix domain-containing protein n=1 Tax=Yinghuangia sp. YIM S09857 TaxID=3436929 RepID=UPI003F537F6F